MLKEKTKERLAAVQGKKPGPLSNLHNGNSIKPVGTLSTQKVLSPKETSLEKITSWAAKKTNSAWPKIKKDDIVNGLKAITEGYYASKSYTEDYKETYLNQGNYPCCGPAALMFYCAKKGIDNFIDTIIYLYETGKIKGWKRRKQTECIVKEKLKQYDANPEVFYWGKENFKSYNSPAYLGACRINWMFNASMAQKETSIPIQPEKNDEWMFYTATEMEDQINFLFNPAKDSLIRTYATNWGKRAKYLNHIDDWIKILNKKGTVFWLMQGNAISNHFNGRSEAFFRLKISDLHWVVIVKAIKLEKSVKLVFHSWGKIYTWEIQNEDLRSMTRASIAFIPQ